jgi:hypothetical protein
MSPIHVTIDRLVLRGLDPAGREAFVHGLRSELAQQLANPAIRAACCQSRRTPVLKLGMMAIEPGNGATRRLGQGVARAIGRGIKS